MKKFFSAFILLALSLATFAGCGNSNNSGKEEIHSKEESTEISDMNKDSRNELTDRIKIATTNSYFPWSFVENGQLQGFAIDVLDEVGRRAGIDIEYIQFGSSEAVYGAMDSGRADLASSQVAITPAIADKYNFTDVYGYNIIKMCVRDDKDYESIEDLHGKKVCIEPGGKLAEFFNGYNENLPDDEKLDLVFTEGSIWEEIELGRFESFPITVLNFNARKEKNEAKNLKLIGDPIIVEDNVFPVSKDMNPELIEKINEALNSMIDDDFIKKASIEWYGIDLTDKSNL